jgi:hypothetical protein
VSNRSTQDSTAPRGPVQVRRALGCVVFIVGFLVVVASIVLMGRLSGLSACEELHDDGRSWVCSREGRLIVGLVILIVLAWPAYAWIRLLNRFWLGHKP